jgi:hypothetical protein
MIRSVKITATVEGSDGVAAGSKQSAPVHGEILAVHLDYVTQPAGTCDVTLTTLSPVQTILSLTNVATDGWFYPRAAAQTNAGVALTFDATEPVPVPYPVDDHLVLTVAQGNAGTVTATILLRE